MYAIRSYYEIIKTLERKTKFARNDFSGHASGYVKTVKEQIVASNRNNFV